MEVRPLQESDDRSTFRSGNPELDRFFSQYAGQNQFRHHLGTTYVAVEHGSIQGYVTVAAGSIETESLPDTIRHKVPRYPLPVLRLARLAVEASAKNRGVGTVLLRHVFLLARKLDDGFGCVGIVVDAKDDAVDYYAKFGFTSLHPTEGQIGAGPRPTPMFLPLPLVLLALNPRPQQSSE